MQCSVLVNARDLAVMAATVADGGVNPLTGVRVIDEEHCTRVLAVLATAGLYERSGEWLGRPGCRARAGSAGGSSPSRRAKGALGTWSPPPDEAGNSVRGQALTRRLADDLGLNLFAAHPYEAG